MEIETCDDEPSIFDFKILKSLGKGCQAEVLQIVKLQTRQHYAIKVIPIHNLDQKQKERVEFEVKSNLYLSNQLKSRYFPKMYHCFQNKQAISIVFELCTQNADTAFKKLPNYVQRYNFIIVMLFDMLKALKQLQALNIVHRDIKPENILMKNGEFKLADLGLSRIISSENNSLTNNIGNRLGRSPQFASGNYNSRADIWSLGIHIFYMFQSTLPFDEGSLARIRNNPNQIEKVIASPLLAIDLQASGRKSKNILSFLHLVLSEMIVINPNYRSSASRLIAQYYSLSDLQNISQLTRWLLISYLNDRQVFGQYYLILLLGNQQFYRMDSKVKIESQPNKRLICLKVKNTIYQIVKLMACNFGIHIQLNHPLVYTIRWILQQWELDLGADCESDPTKYIREIDEVLNLFKINKVREKFPLIEWIVKLFKIAMMKYHQQETIRLYLWDLPLQIYKMI